MHKLFNVKEFVNLGAQRAQFIETGSNYGEGIATAIRAGYQFIQSVESSQQLNGHCKAMFQFFPEVKCIHGSSVDKLEWMLHAVDRSQPLFIWLDAHIDLGNRVLNPGWKIECPLYEELSTIAKFEFDRVVIAIDDMRMLEKADWGTNIVKETLLEYVNKAVKNPIITYADGDVKDDIMIITQ